MYLKKSTMILFQTTNKEHTVESVTPPSEGNNLGCFGLRFLYQHRNVFVITTHSVRPSSNCYSIPWILVLWTILLKMFHRPAHSTAASCCIHSFGVIGTWSWEVSSLPTDETFSEGKLPNSRVHFCSASVDLVLRRTTPVTNPPAHLLISVSLGTVSQSMARLSAVEAHHVALFVCLPLQPSVLSSVVLLQCHGQVLVKPCAVCAWPGASPREGLSGLFQVIHEPVHIFVVIVFLLAVCLPCGSEALAPPHREALGGLCPAVPLRAVPGRALLVLSTPRVFLQLTPWRCFRSLAFVDVISPGPACHYYCKMKHPSKVERG